MNYTIGVNRCWMVLDYEIETFARHVCILYLDDYITLVYPIIPTLKIQER